MYGAELVTLFGDSKNAAGKPESMTAAVLTVAAIAAAVFLFKTSKGKALLSKVKDKIHA
jgi:hypothetical protein